MRVCKRELDELRSVNGTLGNRLEALGSLGNVGHRSLLSEMECEDSTLSPTDELQHVSELFDDFALAWFYDFNRHELNNNDRFMFTDEEGSYRRV